MFTIVLRTVLIYLLLFVVLRLMGKRQIGELQTSEFVITVLLSEIASAPITNESIPLLHAVVPILILLVTEILISVALLRFNFLKKIFYGKPSVLIRRGTIDEKELRRNRMEIDELLSALRQQGYSDVSDIRYAILEENGALSVFPNAARSSLTPSDMKLTTEERGLAHLLLLDGRLISENLALSGWTEDRLDKELRRRGLSRKDVFLFSADDAGTVNCVKKEDAP